MDLRTAVTMLPTPRATDGTKGGPNQRGSSGDLMLPSAVARLDLRGSKDLVGNGLVGGVLPGVDLDEGAEVLDGFGAQGDGHDATVAHDFRADLDESLTSFQLLPTPAVNDMGEGKTPEAWDEWTAKMKAAHGNGNGHGASLSIEAQRLLPTPTAVTRDRRKEDIQNRRDTRKNKGLNLDEVRPEEWGQYAAAIARWEALTRPAPPPTEAGPKGNPRLSAAFSEWMLGLPAGWVTDVPGVTRSEALKAIGNGVCPQQCAAALRILLASEVAA